MTFILTEEWLREFYGSNGPDQVRTTRNWLLRYGKDVPEDKLELWSEFKHLAEYQVNTPDIVDMALNMLGTTHPDVYHVHALLNKMRVPVAFESYHEVLLKHNPCTILELGVGGDSAISTACFIYHLTHMNNPQLTSIDINPLGMTWERYKDVSFWHFIESDSVDMLVRYASAQAHFDMVFIDTIHSYTHTKRELEFASKITRRMLMDDATFEGNDFDPEPGGVKRAIEEWLKENDNWVITEYGGGSVALLERIY